MAHVGLFLSFFIVVGIMLAGYAGIAISPIAAVTCALLAKRRGLSASKYALVGGAYSLMLLAPAVYLILRLLDRRLPLRFVQFVYLGLILCWVLGPILSSAWLLWFERSNAISLVGNLAMLILWVAWWYLRQGPVTERDDVMPPVSYVLPFLFAGLGLILFFNVL